MKKIVIVSSGQPSANPRAVKEALLLSENGFEISFIYCPISAWADGFDKQLFAEHPAVRWICAGSHPVYHKWGYRFARLRKKIYSKLTKLFPGSGLTALRASVLFAQQLERAALAQRADLYIGHNLGAIRAVIKAAKKHRAKAGFDAEDFHRGEYKTGDKDQAVIAAIENKYFQQLDYCTAASPLIAEAYSALFPKISFVTINNVFSVSNLQSPSVEHTGLDLFWFSQFIGPARGLEQVIDALNICGKEDIRLHLLGNIKADYKTALTDRSKYKNIFFIEPVSNEKIFEIAASFDIGLASEVTGTLNREYCLTNKIFTYLLAGNGLLLSQTKAQGKFLQEYPGTGVLYPQNAPELLAEAIKKLYNDRSLLAEFKKQSHNTAASTLNWEKEGQQFLSLIHQTISQAKN